MNAKKLFLPRIRLGGSIKTSCDNENIQVLYSTLTPVSDGALLFTKSRSQERTASANGVFVQSSTLLDWDSVGTGLRRVRRYRQYI